MNWRKGRGGRQRSSRAIGFVDIELVRSERRHPILTKPLRRCLVLLQHPWLLLMRLVVRPCIPQLCQSLPGLGGDRRQCLVKKIIVIHGDNNNILSDDSEENEEE